MRYSTVFIICSILLLTCGAREETNLPPAVDLTLQTKGFVNMLTNGDYAGCVSNFDVTMKNGLPESKLEEAWNTIQGQVGTFQKQVGVRQTREGGYDVVYVTCQFEKGNMDVKVVYSGTQEVTGLWFRPAK